MGNSGVVQANSGPTGYEYVVKAVNDGIQPIAGGRLPDGRTGRAGKELAGDRVTRAGTAYFLGKKPTVFSIKLLVLASVCPLRQQQPKVEQMTAVEWS